MRQSWVNWVCDGRPAQKKNMKSLNTYIIVSLIWHSYIQHSCTAREDCKNFGKLWTISCQGNSTHTHTIHTHIKREEYPKWKRSFELLSSFSSAPLLSCLFFVFWNYPLHRDVKIVFVLARYGVACDFSLCDQTQFHFLDKRRLVKRVGQITFIPEH